MTALPPPMVTPTDLMVVGALALVVFGVPGLALLAYLTWRRRQEGDGE